MVRKGGRWHVGAMKSRHFLGKRREVERWSKSMPGSNWYQGIGEQGQRQQSSHLAKTRRPFPAVAANLAMIKDRGQSVGQNSNHRQHDECDALVHGRLFEMGVSSKGLECGGVDGPAASAQLVNELRRDGT